LEAEATTSQADPTRAGRLDPAVIALPVAFGLCLALLPVHIDTVWGLPAHPLFLHLPVLLVPLLGVGAIALALHPTWRQRYGLALAVAALVTMAATILTAGAGDAFRAQRQTAMGGLAILGGGAPPTGLSQQVSALDLHAQLGNTLRLLVIFLTAAILVQVLAERLATDPGEGNRVRTAAAWLGGRVPATALSAAVVILAALSIVWVVRTGHQGAKVAWGNEPPGAGAQPPGGAAPSQGFPGSPPAGGFPGGSPPGGGFAPPGQVPNG
jgi:hypothetical protein